MRLKNIIFTLAALMLSTGMHAQLAGGRLIGMANFSPGDAMLFSQTTNSFSTARSAAMGGAFTSLGADLSSMYINPAGLGMYRTSEFAFAPSLSWTTTTSSCPSSSFTTGLGDANKRTRFAMGALGVALNVMQGTGSTTSVTVGFGYNRLADFNYNSTIGLDNQGHSITDIFAQQVRGIPSKDLGQYAYPEQKYYGMPGIWGAALGYQCYAIETDGADDMYKSMKYGANDSYLVHNSIGSLGEYDISAGMNFNNRVYLGFTIGIQSLYNKQTAAFEEFFGSNTAEPDLLKALQYDQVVAFSGTGVNFKGGVIVRPVDALRIGLAIHSPTIMTIEQEYYISNMTTEPQVIAKPDDIISAGLGTYEWVYNYISPTRLMLGISYQLSSFALISADYERTWYNGMRLNDNYEYPVTAEERDEFNEDVKYSFKGADNVRLGLEIKPIPQLAMRGGFSYQGSGIKDKKYIVPSIENPTSSINSPVATKTLTYSLGLGVRFGAFSIDVTYLRADTDYTQYGMFWYTGEDNTGANVTLGSGPVRSSMQRHLVNSTFGFRF